jgi:hypothetical protein
MTELLDIEDMLEREQLAMTFNRAACDSILAVASQLPYIAKVFFFACLDKLANIMVQIGRFDRETSAWNYISSQQFIAGELSDFVASIPEPPGDNLVAIVQMICDTLRIDHITSQLLRDYRNSLHGYNLARETVERLFRHSGEINNDLTLLATPLVLFILNLPWLVSTKPKKSKPVRKAFGTTRVIIPEVI